MVPPMAQGYIFTEVRQILNYFSYKLTFLINLHTQNINKYKTIQFQPHRKLSNNNQMMDLFLYVQVHQ